MPNQHIDARARTEAAGRAVAVGACDNFTLDLLLEHYGSAIWEWELNRALIALALTRPAPSAGLLARAIKEDMIPSRRLSRLAEHRSVTVAAALAARRDLPRTALAALGDRRSETVDAAIAANQDWELQRHQADALYSQSPRRHVHALTAALMNRKRLDRWCEYRAVRWALAVIEGRVPGDSDAILAGRNGNLNALGGATAATCVAIYRTWHAGWTSSATWEKFAPNQTAAGMLGRRWRSEVLMLRGREILHYTPTPTMSRATAVTIIALASQWQGDWATLVALAP